MSEMFPEDPQFGLLTQPGARQPYSLPDTDFQLSDPIGSGVNAFSSFGRDLNAAWKTHTFVGQMSTQSKARLLVGEDNEWDPDFDIWEQLTDQEKEAARINGYDEIAGIGSAQMLKQWRITKQANAFYRRELEDASIATIFVASMLDLDALAPLGVARGIGAAAGFRRGAAYAGMSTAATESLRVGMDPDAEAEELLYLPAAFLLGGSIGAGIGAMKPKGAYKTVKASNDLSDKPVTKGDIEKAAEDMTEVYEETLQHNNMKPKDEDAPPSKDPLADEILRKVRAAHEAKGQTSDMAAPDDVEGAAKPKPKYAKDEGDTWEVKSNPITDFAAKMGKQFPYWKSVENGFFKMGDEAKGLANNISRTAQKLAGTMLPNKNGEAEIGLAWRHHTFFGVADEHITAASEVYNAYRGREAGRGGATSMTARELADAGRNLVGRVKGEGPKSRVRFTHEDFMNWIFYPAAYNFDFDQVVAASGKTLRQTFADQGWGQAEWNALVEGSGHMMKFFQRMGDELDADDMKGSAASLKRAEQFEEYAELLRRRSKMHDETRKAVRNDEKAFKVMTEKHKAAFAESLEFDAAAISHRLAAGDIEIASVMYSSLIRVALKQHLENLRKIYPDDVIKGDVDAPTFGAHLRDEDGVLPDDHPIKKITDVLKLDASDPKVAVKSRQILEETLENPEAEFKVIIDRRYDGNNPDEWRFSEYAKRLDELEQQLFHAQKKRGQDFPRKDPNFFSRLIRPDMVDNNEYLRQQAFKAFQEDPTFRGKQLSEVESKIWERVDNMLDNMRRRAVRADSEGLLDEDTGLSPWVPKHQMSRRNPMLDRDLMGSGPGDSVLETDPRIVINAYLNRVGPSISMTREYGDPSAWRAIRNIDYEAEDLAIEHMKKGDWKTAAKVEREGREQVRALTDVRDGVLNTWGYHEDPTTLSARTLRTAKNIGIVTLMGRSGQMVAADAGRLLLAMKLKELADLGMLAVKAPEEFGLAWKEMKMMGEVAEARNNLRLGWLLDVTGSMVRGSKFENFWQRAVGPTFVMSGLAPGTDMLKGITGIHTMSEIVRLSQASAEGTLGLMSKELPESIGEYRIVSQKNIPARGEGQTSPYARTDYDKKIIYYDEDKIRAGFKERSWADQSYLNNEGAPDPLGIDAFKTEEHWMRHVLLHEWMHTKFAQKPGESLKAYETRINQAAFDRLPYHNVPEKGELDMVEKLREFGISDDLAIRINEQWEAAGAQGPKNGTSHIYLANSEKWTDREVKDLFRGAVSQEVNKIIITPNVATRPKFMSTNLWSYLLQFKSFPIAASFQATARLFQAPTQKRVRRMAMGMLAGGYLVQQLRASPFDDDEIDKMMRVVDYSGVIPLLTEVNNITELMTAGNVGIRPMFGGDSVVRDVNFAEQVSPFLGPAGGSALRLAGTLPGGDLAEITKATTRLIPWMNHPANYLPGIVQGLGELAEGEE